MKNKFKIKYLLTTVLSCAVATTVSAKADNFDKQKYGVKVTTCGYDYDDDNFCTDKLLKKYASVAKNRKSNFDKNKIIYIFNSVDARKDFKYYRLVVIDKKTKIVSPLFHALGETTGDDGKSLSVNAKGDKLEFNFNKNSNRFCFKGELSAYRDSYSFDPEHHPEFCFNYDSKHNSLSRDF